MSKKYLRSLFCLLSVFAVLFAQNGFEQAVHANSTPQTVPFTQNWSNPNLITVNDNWDNVPGIIGYRGDDLATAIPTDPQTVVADGSATPVNVNANNTDPTAATSGGVYEFDTLPDPTVGMQGSGTADAPHIVISLNTSGTTALHIAYNLRDLDATDTAIQPFALQYRIGNTGTYTNIPAGFVADASADGGATLVTPVSVNLPAAVENQPLVQFRIITTNAVGNDAMVGVDDINVTGTGGGSTTLSGSGLATPSTVAPGANTLLTVTVTPASSPASTGITVVSNILIIGGSATQQFFDDGTNGDVTAGDNIFSFQTTVAANTPGGNYSFNTTIADAQSRTATTLIPLTVNAPISGTVHLTMGNPSNATTDVNNPTNYLLEKAQYVMSYNRDRGAPNWVSWHLNASWLGSTPRQDDFRPDTSLPAGWYEVTQTDFSGSGFDRGHHTPSGDRTASIPDNSATFLMSNMMAQAPANNQGPWEELESYCRTLVSQGNELYIVAGGAGQGGSGSNGGITNTLANGHVVVPAFTWKVIIVLPNGANDVDRVNKETRTIGVIMANNQSIGINTPWRNFRTSIKQIERLTGFSFFTNVRPQIREMIKRKTDFQ